jgi:putative transposase
LHTFAESFQFIESFNGKFRDERLNQHWFAALLEAQLVIEARRRSE